MAISSAASSVSSDTRFSRLPPRRGQIIARIFKSFILAIVGTVHSRLGSERAEPENFSGGAGRGGSGPGAEIWAGIGAKRPNFLLHSKKILAGPGVAAPLPPPLVQKTALISPLPFLHHQVPTAPMELFVLHDSDAIWIDLLVIVHGFKISELEDMI